jgi:hypothetical protein
MVSVLYNATEAEIGYVVILTGAIAKIGCFDSHFLYATLGVVNRIDPQMKQLKLAGGGG